MTEGLNKAHMQMPLFGLDTADLNEIAKREIAIRTNHLNRFFQIRHVTTNPTLLKKARPDIVELDISEKWDAYLKLGDDISKIPGIDYISVETCGYNQEFKTYMWLNFEMEAQRIYKANNKFLVKIPACRAGFEAMKNSPFACRTNVTLVFNIYQALKAAELGAFCISPFLGRMDDYYGLDAGLRFLEKIANEWQRRDIKETRILAASIRNIDHILGSLKLGVHMLTMPPELYDRFTEEVQKNLEEDQLLIQGLERFKKDWFGEN